MKSKLREKYLGKYYKQKLLDQWYKLRQDDITESDYIAKFNKYEGDEEETKPMEKLERKYPETIEEFKDEIESKSCPNEGLEREY